jgi:hypothetical protein
VRAACRQSDDAEREALASSRGSAPAMRDRALLDWAAATAPGRRRPNGAAPDREEIDAWLPAELRRVRAGSRAALVDVVAERDRSALDLNLVRLPADLPAARLAWLEEICAHTRRCFHLVRIGIDPAAGAVRAEVDLTGAPSGCAQELWQLALAALVASASAALPGLAMAADPSVASRLLDTPPRGRRRESGDH